MTSPAWIFDLDNTLHDARPQMFPHINRGMTEYIMRHLDLGDGDIADARIFHLARDQRRQHPLDLGLDTLRAPVRHHDYCRVLATSTRDEGKSDKAQIVQRSGPIKV